MAEIVEHELAENVRSLPSFIQDTTDFLNKLSTINQPLPNNCLMICMDVKALYRGQILSVGQYNHISTSCKGNN